MSWLKERYEDFQVGAAGLVDAVFDTNYAAQTDAYIDSQEAKEAGASQEQANQVYNDNLATNTKAEENGALDEAWTATEEDIKEGAKKVANGLTWGFGILTVALIAGAAIGVIYLAKKGGA